MFSLALAFLIASSWTAPVTTLPDPTRLVTAPPAGEAPAPQSRPQPRPPRAARPTPDRPARRGPAPDPANRIEVRLGIAPRPVYSSAITPSVPPQHRTSADFGLGAEYLRAFGPDVAIGFAVSTLVLTRHDWIEDHAEDGTRTSGASTFIPAVVRWNFCRRLTAWRLVEPYLTGGVGPLVRTTSVTIGDRHDRDRTSESTTSIGGRLGAGVDVRLGTVFTLGVVGAWNWSDRPDPSIGYGSRDRGAEASVTMGWSWGRSPRSGW